MSEDEVYELLAEYITIILEAEYHIKTLCDEYNETNPSKELTAEITIIVGDKSQIKGKTLH